MSATKDAERERDARAERIAARTQCLDICEIPLEILSDFVEQNRSKYAPALPPIKLTQFMRQQDSSVFVMTLSFLLGPTMVWQDIEIPPELIDGIAGWKGAFDLIDSHIHNAVLWMVETVKRRGPAQ